MHARLPQLDLRPSQGEFRVYVINLDLQKGSAYFMRIYATNGAGLEGFRCGFVGGGGDGLYVVVVGGSGWGGGGGGVCVCVCVGGGGRGRTRTRSRVDQRSAPWRCLPVSLPSANPAQAPGWCHSAPRLEPWVALCGSL